MRGKYRGEQDVGQDRVEGGERGVIENHRYCHYNCGSPKVNMHELEMEETSLTETTIDGEAMENIVPEVVG